MYSKKLIFSIFSAFALVALFSVGCSKSSNSSNSSTISASIGSTNFSANSSNTFAYYSTDSSVYLMTGGTLNSKDTSLMELSIQPPFTLNTVITDSYSVQINYITGLYSGYSAGYGSGSVALTVTSQDTVNHKIAGTFTATLYNNLNYNDSVKVTNGKFSTSYQLLP